MSYQKLDIHPISASIGAEIRGVDLSQPLDDESRREIKTSTHDSASFFFACHWPFKFTILRVTLTELLSTGAI